MIEIVNFIKEFDLHQILSMIVVVWIITSSRMKKVNKKISEIDAVLKDIKISVLNIDNRLTRLEGRFEERGQWESRNKKIGEE